MSGRFWSSIVVTGCVALAFVALPLTATANAVPSMRATHQYPSLKDCSIFAKAARRAFHAGNRVKMWRSDPPTGGCIETSQRFINDAFGYAQWFAASPNGTAARQRLSGIDLAWWPLRTDGEFGRRTAQAVRAWRRFTGLSTGGSLGWRQLDRMHADCVQARVLLGYRTSACAIPHGPH